MQRVKGPFPCRAKASSVMAETPGTRRTIKAVLAPGGPRIAVDGQRPPPTSSTRPDEPVWILTCANAAYRVRLVPNLAAHIERLQ